MTPETRIGSRALSEDEDRALMNQDSLHGSRLIGYAMDANAKVNIETLDDWSLAESYPRSRDA